MDIICHGVPSPKVWQAYVDYRSQKENEGIRPLKINMRSKSSGWSHYGYSTEFRTLNASDYGVLQNRKRIILIGKQAPLR